MGIKPSKLDTLKKKTSKKVIEEVSIVAAFDETNLLGFYLFTMNVSAMLYIIFLIKIFASCIDQMSKFVLNNFNRNCFFTIL